MSEQDMNKALEAELRAADYGHPWDEDLPGRAADALAAARTENEQLRTFDWLKDCKAQVARARADGWDAAVASMRYEDGSPVEIVSVVNPYRTPHRSDPKPTEGNTDV